MFGNNPFNKEWATQQPVQEKKDMSEMCCKSCGDSYGKPTNESCKYESNDPNGSNWIKKENYKEAMDPVNKAELKGKHKDRKDKDIDNDGDTDASDQYLHKRRKAISKATEDTNKEGYYKDLEIKKQDKELGAKPVIGKKKKPGENATMNPKLDSGKTKGSEMEQKESVNVSHIRQALMSVLEGENHSPNKDKAEKPEDALKGAGAKKMKDDNEDDGRYKDLEKQSHDDAAKAGRAGPGKKARPNDSKDGDKKVVNPADDITKKGQAPDVKTESYDNMTGLKEAYASMYQEKDEK